MNNEILVANIRNLCKIKDMGVSQLEKRLGFGSGLISRWTKSDPSLSKVMDVANYFEVSIDLLCNTIISEGNLLYNLFVENLSNKTINRTIKWNILNKNGKDYYAISNLDEIESNRIVIEDEEGNKDYILDQDLFVYMIEEDNDIKIFFVYQMVSEDFTDNYAYNCHEYMYVLIYTSYEYTFIEADKAIINELNNNIKTVFYKEPRNEEIKNIMENFIKK